jgi:hypothetical protein
MQPRFVVLGDLKVWFFHAPRPTSSCARVMLLILQLPTQVLLWIVDRASRFLSPHRAWPAAVLDFLPVCAASAQIDFRLARRW